MRTEALSAAERSGLIVRDEPLLVMLSGGADSVCLLDVAQRLGARVRALHVNYGLRGAESHADEAFCRELCERLGVELFVEPVSLPPGENVQAAAREARYELAERYAEAGYAAAHTLSDQAETVLYRLGASPGRRAVTGMRPRRGRLVRPLLEVTRADTREHCRAAGLRWREDASNADPRYARARIRHELLPLLEEIAPGAERTIAATASRLQDEADVLDAAVAQARTDDVERLRALPPALARLVLRDLAGGSPLSARDAAAILAPRGGSASFDVGGGVRAVVEYGRVRFVRGGGAPAPAPVELDVPGNARFGAFEVEARAAGDGLAADALGDRVTVRSWRPGDRMRPMGLGGSRKLQDLFVDRKVPREQRPLVPVVEAGGEIAWVAGVAADERFRAPAGASAIAFSARRVDL